MRTKSTAVLLALSACAFAASAQGLNATVQARGIQFSLIDLDPADGIDPTLSPGGLEQIGSGAVWLNDTMVSDEETSALGFTPTHLTLSGTGYSGSLALEVPPGPKRLDVTLSAALDPAAAGGALTFTIDTQYDFSFHLSPHTMLIASTELSYSFSGENVAAVDGTYKPYVNSSTYLNLRGDTYYSGGGPSYHQDISVSDSDGLNSAGVRDASTSFSARVFNDSEGEFDCFLRVSIGAWGGYRFVSNVPEPATSALFLAGLAAAGFAGRRQRRST